jgi:hypothetical protein
MGIVAMQPINWDGLHLQRPKARLEIVSKISLGEPSRLHIVERGMTAFRGDEDAVAIGAGLEPTPKDGFTDSLAIRDPDRVSPGGIEKVAAGIDKLIEQAKGFVFRNCGPHRPSTQTNGRNLIRGVRDGMIAHGNGPFVLLRSKS